MEQLLRRVPPELRLYAQLDGEAGAVGHAGEEDDDEADEATRASASAAASDAMMRSRTTVRISGSSSSTDGGDGGGDDALRRSATEISSSGRRGRTTAATAAAASHNDDDDAVRSPSRSRSRRLFEQLKRSGSRTARFRSPESPRREGRAGRGGDEDALSRSADKESGKHRRRWHRRRSGSAAAQKSTDAPPSAPPVAQRTDAPEGVSSRGENAPPQTQQKRLLDELGGCSHGGTAWRVNVEFSPLVYALSVARQFPAGANADQQPLTAYFSNADRRLGKMADSLRERLRLAWWYGAPSAPNAATPRPSTVSSGDSRQTWLQGNPTRSVAELADHHRGLRRRVELRRHDLLEHARTRAQELSAVADQLSGSLRRANSSGSGSVSRSVSVSRSGSASFAAVARSVAQELALKDGAHRGGRANADSADAAQAGLSQTPLPSDIGDADESDEALVGDEADVGTPLMRRAEKLRRARACVEEQRLALAAARSLASLLQTATSTARAGDSATCRGNGASVDIDRDQYDDNDGGHAVARASCSFLSAVNVANAAFESASKADEPASDRTASSEPDSDLYAAEQLLEVEDSIGDATRTLMNFMRSQWASGAHGARLTAEQVLQAAPLATLRTLSPRPAALSGAASAPDTAERARNCQSEVLAALAHFASGDAAREEQPQRATAIDGGACKSSVPVRLRVQFARMQAALQQLLSADLVRLCSIVPLVRLRGSSLQARVQVESLLSNGCRWSRHLSAAPPCLPNEAVHGARHDPAASKSFSKSIEQHGMLLSRYAMGVLAIEATTGADAEAHEDCAASLVPDDEHPGETWLRAGFGGDATAMAEILALERVGRRTLHICESMLRCGRALAGDGGGAAAKLTSDCTLTKALTELCCEVRRMFNKMALAIVHSDGTAVYKHGVHLCGSHTGETGDDQPNEPTAAGAAPAVGDGGGGATAHDARCPLGQQRQPSRWGAYEWTRLVHTLVTFWNAVSALWRVHCDTDLAPEGMPGDGTREAAASLAARCTNSILPRVREHLMMRIAREDDACFAGAQGVAWLVRSWWSISSEFGSELVLAYIDGVQCAVLPRLRARLDDVCACSDGVGARARLQRELHERLGALASSFSLMEATLAPSGSLSAKHGVVGAATGAAVAGRGAAAADRNRASAMTALREARSSVDEMRRRMTCW